MPTVVTKVCVGKKTVRDVLVSVLMPVTCCRVRRLLFRMSSVPVSRVIVPTPS